jgi:alpha-beta hydrolase superfamily lysophospholipase
MPGGYGKTLHKSQLGEWEYNLKYKPLYGFPLYPAWFRMIHKAHASVRAGLGLQTPILAMRSSSSRFASDPPLGDDFRADTVLNVDHIRDLAPRLSSRVTPCVIGDGLHDLYLSREPARATALTRTIEFLRNHDPK